MDAMDDYLSTRGHPLLLGREVGGARVAGTMACIPRMGRGSRSNYLVLGLALAIRTPACSLLARHADARGLSARQAAPYSQEPRLSVPAAHRIRDAGIAPDQMDHSPFARPSAMVCPPDGTQGAGLSACRRTWLDPPKWQPAPLG